MLRISSALNFRDATTVKLKWYTDTVEKMREKRKEKKRKGKKKKAFGSSADLVRDIAVRSAQIKFHILKTVFFVNLLLPF